MNFKNHLCLLDLILLLFHYKCISAIIAKDLEAHCKECCENHLNLAMKYIQVLEAKETQMQHQIQDLTLQVHFTHRRA
jgi:hypothetical protein